jgi:hypothetical protein
MTNPDAFLLINPFVLSVYCFLGDKHTVTAYTRIEKVVDGLFSNSSHDHLNEVKSSASPKQE